MSMSPKAALIKDGVVAVKEGKGRLSNEAKARLDILMAKGWDITGYVPSKPVAAAPGGKSVDKSFKRVANVKVVEDYVILNDEREYKAVDAVTRKMIGSNGGMREVCRPCGVSLVQCHCGNPVIVGDRKVSIVKR